MVGGETINIGPISYAEYIQIQQKLAEVRKLPLGTPKSIEEHKKFISDLVKIGTQIDHLFSLGRASEWSMYVAGDLIETYTLWALRCYILLRSKYGIKEGWRLKYPDLSENDGVSGLIGEVVDPGGVKVTHRGTWFGIELAGGRKVIDKEGINQFMSAHASLKRKIRSLSQILKLLSGSYSDKKTTLVLNTSDPGKISAGNFTYSAKRKKAPRWVKLLIFLFKEKEDASGKDIRDHLKYKSLNTLSRSIRDLNRLTRKHLELEEDVIIHKKNDRGYQINPRYRIELVS